MTTIHKYPVPIADRWEQELPVGARFLSVQVQRGQAQMWWLVEDSLYKQARTFRVHGTGHDVPRADTLTHLGTFQLAAGSLVFHLFEERWG